MKLFTALTLISISLSSFSSAHKGQWTAARPDGHAPISVMGDHMHEMGEWMVSYRYMSMDMEGLLKGSSSVAPTMMATGFMPNMLPTEMTMDMHMFGTMYAISNKWTLMGMLNYLDNEMTMPMGKMDSSGTGDLKEIFEFTITSVCGKHQQLQIRYCLFFAGRRKLSKKVIIHLFTSRLNGKPCMV